MHHARQPRRYPQAGTSAGIDAGHNILGGRRRHTTTRASTPAARRRGRRRHTTSPASTPAAHPRQRCPGSVQRRHGRNRAVDAVVRSECFGIVRPAARRSSRRSPCSARLNAPTPTRPRRRSCRPERGVVAAAGNEGGEHEGVRVARSATARHRMSVGPRYATAGIARSPPGSRCASNSLATRVERNRLGVGNDLAGVEVDGGRLVGQVVEPGLDEDRGQC